MRKDSGMGAVEVLCMNSTDHSHLENTRGLFKKCISGCLGMTAIPKHTVWSLLQRVAITHNLK